jgi:flagellar motor switch protein FliG
MANQLVTSAEGAAGVALLEQPAPESLDLIEQAAIVLLSMGEEPAAGVLRCLEREDLLAVTQVMSRLSGIRVDSVRQSLQHFFDDYREQSGVHGASRSFLQRSLALALGGDIAGSVLDSIYGDEIRPKMARLQWAAPAWLAERLAQEHPRMQAVFLAFLPPKLAGDVIEHLPESGREALVLNVAKLKDVDRDLLVQLEMLTEQYLAEFGTQSVSMEGVKQAAEILNRIPGNKQELVERLRARDPEIASAIETEMYDFFVLSTQSETTLTQIIEAVPAELWALALKGAEPAVRKAVLGAMPRRQAQSFEDQMRRSGPVPLSRVEQARREIMDLVKAMVDAGELEIQLFAEAVVE